MTKLLEKAFKKASMLPSKAQDALGARLLEELEILKDEAKWEAAFARTQAQLERWADEVRADIEAGKVLPMFDERGRFVRPKRSR